MMIKKVAFIVTFGLLLSSPYAQAGRNPRSSSNIQNISTSESRNKKNSSHIEKSSTRESEDGFDQPENEGDDEGWGNSLVSSLRNGCGKITGGVAAGLTAVSAALAAVVIALVGGSHHSAPQDEHNQY